MCRLHTLSPHTDSYSRIHTEQASPHPVAPSVNATQSLAPPSRNPGHTSVTMTVQPQYLPTPVPTPPPNAGLAASSSLINKKKQPQPPYLPNRHDYKPTHPDLFQIEFGPEGEEFGSCLRAQKVRLRRV